MAKGSLVMLISLLSLPFSFNLKDRVAWGARAYTIPGNPEGLGVKGVLTDYSFALRFKISSDRIESTLTRRNRLESQ